MKKSFPILNLEVAEAAVKDATNFGLSAILENKDGENVLSFESKAYCDAPCEPKPICWDDLNSFAKSLYSEIEYQVKWVKEDLKYLSQEFYEHKRGHIPQILDVGKLQAAIDTLGIGDSYSVKKADVYIQY